MSDYTPEGSASGESFSLVRKEAAMFRPSRRRQRVNPIRPAVDPAGFPPGLKPPAFYIPDNLDLAQFEEGHRLYVAYFLNLIRWKWLCWQTDENGFVPLKRDYLRHFIPDDIFETIRRQLCQRGVIEQSLTHSVGKESKRFRVMPEFWHTHRIVIPDKSFAKKIKRHSEHKNLLPVHRRLNEWLSRIEFDAALAERIIPDMRPDATSRIGLHEYHAQIREMCRSLENGDVAIDSADRFGRVHTPLTRLPRELRGCVHVSGQTLVAVDLANSQPLMAGIVATSYFRNRTAAQRIRDRDFSDGANPYHNRFPESFSTDRPDLADYLRVCESGQLYESLMSAGDTRDKVKVDFLTAMYSANTTKLPLKRTMRVKYPSVASMLTDLKRFDHRRAAHIMQNAESTIFIHAICTRILNNPNCVHIPLFTLHDSLLTVPPYAAIVRSHMLDVFSQLGIQPLIKTSNTTTQPPLPITP